MSERDHLLEDRLSGIFQPDTLLPSQFFAALRQKGHLGGEKRLMMAVLEDAVDCFQKHMHAQDKRGKQQFADAEEWIMSDDTSWLFSFVNICDILELDPGFLRRGLLAWKNQQLSPADSTRGKQAKVYSLSCRKPRKKISSASRKELRNATGS